MKCNSSTDSAMDSITDGNMLDTILISRKSHQRVSLSEVDSK